MRTVRFVGCVVVCTSLVGSCEGPQVAVDRSVAPLRSNDTVDASQSLFANTPLAFEGSCNFLACCSEYGKRATQDQQGFSCADITCPIPLKNKKKNDVEYVPSFFCGIDGACDDANLWLSAPFKSEDVRSLCGHQYLVCHGGKHAIASLKDKSHNDGFGLFWEASPGVEAALGLNDGTTNVQIYSDPLDPAAVADPECGFCDNLQFDSLPSAQGWSYVPTLTGAPETGVFSVDGTTLRQNSIGLGDNAAPHYERRGSVDPTRPFTLLVRAQILQEEVFRDNRFGFTVGATTDDESFDFGISEEGLEDENGIFFTPGFDATQFHDFRIEITPGVGYALFIDNAPAASGTPSPLGDAATTLILGDESQNNASVVITRFEYCPHQ